MRISDWSSDVCSSDLLHAIDYRILLFTTDFASEVDPSVEEVLQYNVDMLVMASTILTSSLAEECRKAGTPVIMFNRTTGESGTWSVTGENLDGGREIADFLVAAGHDHFAFIAGIENSSTRRDREAGYSHRLLQHGKGKPVREVGNYTFEGATEAARALFKRHSRPNE